MNIMKRQKKTSKEYSKSKNSTNHNIEGKQQFGIFKNKKTTSRMRLKIWE